MLLSLVAERQRVHNVVKLSETLPNDNLLLHAEWAKYISVVTSGYMEEGIRLILTEYVKIGVVGKA